MSHRRRLIGAACQRGPIRLTAALIEAQREIRAPVKNRSVSVRSGRQNYDFAYATLDSIIENVLRPVLPTHGLWFTQYMERSEEGPTMIIDILHTSGESRPCPIAMPELSQDPHEAGSLITYFKRYGLCAAFGLVADDDDDARLIADRSDAMISPDQVKELEELAGGAQSELDRLCRYLKVSSLAAISSARFERAKAALQLRRVA